MLESFLPLGKMAAFNPSQILSTQRVRRLQRSFYNFRVTVLCLFVTVLMLRGMLGAGKFGTPNRDLVNIKDLVGGDRAARKTMEYMGIKPSEQELEGEKEDLTSVKPRVFNPQTVHHPLGDPILDWDEQRAAYMGANKGANLTHSGKPRILLVSGSQPKPCENALGDYFTTKNLKNKIDYCRLHDIEIFFNMAHFDTVMSGFWAKLPLLRRLMLKHPDVEWFWWMDSDAYFTDMMFELPMEKYHSHNLVIHGWDNMLYGKKAWTGVNTGSFLLRNCQWSLDMLDAWAPYGPRGKPRLEAGKLFSKYLSGRPEFEADDQSALVYLLLSQREVWGEKTYLESSFYLHGYWLILVKHFEQMMEKYHPGLGDERWPFVTHFVGCKPCHGGYGEYSPEECAKQMERSFNFADNQVLEFYGFRHSNLETTKVEKVAESRHSHGQATERVKLRG